jgi:hypothetical protein
MPVTAKLSRKFYERLGDDVATELVEWFNQVDASYRSDWRDLNETNFARFDAKLEQRLAELRAELRQEISTGDAALRTEMRVGFADLRADLLKWMFVYWLGSVATTAGLVLTVVGLLRR